MAKDKMNLDMKIRVYSIFVILKVLEIGSLLFVPIYSYKLLSPFIFSWNVGFPEVTNLFLQWVLGVCIDFWLVLALAIAATLLWAVWKILDVLILRNYFRMNMEWAKRIAGATD